MSVEQQGQNHAQQNLGMAIDPKWSAEEKAKYTAAYNNAKKEADNKG